MEWKTGKEGETRIITRFLILPLELDGVKKWLCNARILQFYNKSRGWWDYKWVSTATQKPNKT